MAEENSKIKAIRGSSKRPTDVKQWLMDHGATDVEIGTHTDYIYLNKNDIFYVSKANIVRRLDPSHAELVDIEELPRWRAQYGKTYYFIDSQLTICHTEDMRIDADNVRYNKGNYFVSFEEACSFKKLVSKLFEENTQC